VAWRTSQGLLIAARAIQGLGGAVVTAVALSLIMNLFTEPTDRAKAMGIYGFVCSAGGSVGVLLGGFLTTTLNWHWIFLVNVPSAGWSMRTACASCPTPQVPRAVRSWMSPAQSP
jgi:MFS family permease